MECVSIHQPSPDEIESKLVDKDAEAVITSNIIRWGTCLCAVPQDLSMEVETLLTEEDENCEGDNDTQGRSSPLSCVRLNPITPSLGGFVSGGDETQVVDTSEAVPILITATDSSSSEDGNGNDEVVTLPSFADVTAKQRKDSNFWCSLDFLADRFADMLCPGSTVVPTTSGSPQSRSSPPTSISAKTSARKRQGQEDLKRLRSVSSLVTAASLIQDSSTAPTAVINNTTAATTRRPATPFPPATSCTDLTLVNDMMAPNGLELLTAIREWFASPTNRNSVMNDDLTRPRIRNRSTVTPTSLRSRRVMNLWNQWHAEASAIASFRADSIKPCPSLDQAQGADPKWHHHHHHPRQSPTSSSSSSPSSTTSPSKRLQDALDLCYDSDPEVILRSLARRRLRRKKLPKYQRCRPGSIKTVIDLSPSEDETARQWCPPPSPQRFQSKASRRFFGREKSPNSVMDYPQSTPCYDHPKDYDAAIQEIIKEVAIGKISLVYHGMTPPTVPTPVTPEGSNLSRPHHRSAAAAPPPQSVRAWFEFGRRLGNIVVQPKLVWCPAYHPQMLAAGASATTTGARRYCALPSSLQTLDLLSVVRVLQPKTIDRDLYPYARVGRTFQIKSQDNRTFLFEATCRGECERFVTGLKLMVARLASIVIVRDESMLHEFFSPWAHSPMLDKMMKEMHAEEEEAKKEASQRTDVTTSVQRILKLPSSKGFGGKAWAPGL